MKEKIHWKEVKIISPEGVELVPCSREFIEALAAFWRNDPIEYEISHDIYDINFSGWPDVLYGGPSNSLC